MPPRPKKPTVKLAVVSKVDADVVISTVGTKAMPPSSLSSWRLAWGDGHAEEGPGLPPARLAHRYLESADVAVQLTAVDSKGLSNAMSIAVSVWVMPPSPIPPNPQPIPPGGGWLFPPTIIANSCSAADVNAAAVLAAVNGVVGIPGGTCVWGAAQYINTEKRVNFTGVGAGTDAQCAVPGQTAYTCLTQGADNVDGLVFMTSQFEGGPRLGGITFDSGAGPQYSPDQGLLNISGASPSFRFDHNKVYSRRGGAMRFHHFVRGVLDHNFFSHQNNHVGIYVFHGGWNSASTTGGGTCPSYDGQYFANCGDRAWADDTKLGSADFLFFEQNTIRGDRSDAIYFMDGWKGTRYVIRNNEIYNTTFEIHGTDTAGRVRGGRALEFYRNNIHADIPSFSVPAVFAYRGGTGTVWGNAITLSNGGFLSQIADLNHYRTLADNQCSYWYCADTTATIDANSHAGDWHVGQGGLGMVPANYFDFNPGSGLSYPAMDQTGRGKGTLLTGDEFTGGVVPTGWPTQVPDPIYCHGNTRNGAVSNCESTNGNFIQLNRDYYRDSGVQTSASSPFNGTTGMGWGTIARRPATCTPGVGYWATDEGEWDSSQGGPDGKMYLCTAPNTWSARYGADGTNTTGLPYTFPHPLNV